MSKKLYNIEDYTITAERAKGIAFKYNLERSGELYEIIIFKIPEFVKKGKYSAEIYFKYDNKPLNRKYDLAIRTLKEDNNKEIFITLGEMLKKKGYSFSYKSTDRDIMNDILFGELYELSWEHCTLVNDQPDESQCVIV